MAGSVTITDTTVWTYPIHVTDAAGDVVPASSTDVFSTVSDTPASFNAVIGADATGAPAVVVNSLVQAGGPYTVTTTDSAGLTSDVTVFTVTSDTTPKNLVLDIVDGTSVSQPVPAAVGP